MALMNSMAAVSMVAAGLLVGAPAKPAAPAGTPAAKAPAADAKEAAAKQAGPNPLAVGNKVPAGLTLQNAAGESVKVESLWAEKPVVVVFYRGGWCPFCNKSLAGWEASLPDLKAAGANIVAIAMEKPAELAATTAKDKLSYTTLSDADGSTCKAFGLLFSVDDTTKKAYEGYGVDLAAKNANGQWQLPHPGTFVIDKGGVVRFSKASADYRTRVAPAEVIAAVKAI